PFDWSLNPYMGCAHRCTFCYVRAFEQRADRPADDRYGTTIRVKVNVADVLARELGRRSWQGEHVAIGAATDPYQPAEGRYRLTRACLEVFARAANPFSLITRGPMIVRDIDVLVEAARHADVSVMFSVPTLDPEVWRTTEPGTAPPRQRLRALSRLVAAEPTVGPSSPFLPPGDRWVTSLEPAAMFPPPALPEPAPETPAPVLESVPAADAAVGAEVVVLDEPAPAMAGGVTEARKDPKRPADWSWEFVPEAGRRRGRRR
ncbi:MAG: radical SAM protein, partial [Actinomycetota bacterium]